MTFLLSFLPDMIAVQYLLAEDLGFADNCGIDFDFRSGAEVENPVQLVLSGAVDYAVIDTFTYVSAVHRGLPLMAIAAEDSETGVSYASLKKTGVEGPEDLPGHTVGIQPGLDSALFIQFIMDQFLTSEEQASVKQVPVGFEIQPLMAGSVDVITLWPTNTNINVLIEEGFEFNLIKASDFDVDLSANVIVTTQERIAQKPDEVDRVVAAISAGQVASLDDANTERAVDLVLEALGEPDVDRDVERRLYEEVQKVKDHASWMENGPGWNFTEGFEQIQAFLLQAGEIDKELPPESLFTNEYLEDVFEDGELTLESVCG